MVYFFYVGMGRETSKLYIVMIWLILTFTVSFA